jgi:selenide,water dikinase
MMMRPWPEARVTVVLDTPVAVYSGMVPGFVAGQYRASELEIDVVPLARLAGAEVVLAAAVGVDPANRRVRLDGRGPLAYDFVSFDVGSTVAGLDLPGVRETARATRPISRLVREIGSLSESFLAHEASRPFEVVVAGGGAGGIELAFTVRERLLGAARRAGVERRLRVTLLQALPEVLTGFPPSLAVRARRNAAARGITIRTGESVAAAEPGLVRLESGEVVPTDSLVWAVGAGSLDVFRDSGLPLDDRGFVLTRPTLQTLGDARVFAVGDCATLQDWPATPKAGVYAVRQGPFIADNLRRAVAGRPLRRYRPQADFLTLLNLGDGLALGAKWGTSFEGRWVMRLKDWIDRKFMRMFQVLDDAGGTTDEFSRMDRSAMEAMVCGGCAAKAGQTTLDRALGRLREELGSGLGGDGHVRLGLDQSDDAAAFATPRGDVVVSSVDWFKAFSGDHWLNGKVAAANALSDLFATGAAPRYAMALVNLPEDEAPDASAETLYLLLAGARSLLDGSGVALLGGHTTVGPELTVGFSVEGHPIGEHLLTLDRLRVGDGLYLTKRLGSGVVLRGVMLGQGRGPWLEAATRQMVCPNGRAARAAVASGLRAATDITGFGLMNHLAEMLRASGVSAELDVSLLPALPGAEELLGSGLRSTAHEQNRRIAKAIRIEAAASRHPRLELLFDPQTAGGFLAGVPEMQAADFLGRLREADVDAVRIGTVVPRPDDGAVATIRAA